MSKCVKQFTKKYTSIKRKSPPYPANSCKGRLQRGNDGLLYKSTRNSNGVYTWKKTSVDITSVTLRKSKSPKSKSKKSPKKSPKLIKSKSKSANMNLRKAKQELRKFGKIWEAVSGRNQDIGSALTMEEVKRSLKYYKSAAALKDLKERIREGGHNLTRAQVTYWLNY